MVEMTELCGSDYSKSQGYESPDLQQFMVTMQSPMFQLMAFASYIRQYGSVLSEVAF